MFDTERQTGRTTRVVEEAVRFSKSEIGLSKSEIGLLFVYCANFREVSRIRHMFLSMGGYERNVKFVSVSEDLRGYQPTKELWDNYAIDVWKLLRVEEIERKAEALRKSQP